MLCISCPEIAELAKPGQFVNISCNQFLRRPIGIMDVDRKKGEFSVGIKSIGEGTNFLASLKHGDNVSVLGPLGHGFDLDNYDRIITVGGGTGIFPLFFVQKHCQENNIEGIAVCGYRSREESFLTEEFSQISCSVSFASDAGDLMIAGNAGDALIKLLDEKIPEDGRSIKTLIAACGPKAMMQSIASIAKNRNIDCQVSLEERMACGIGICLVCACKIKKQAETDDDSADKSDNWEHRRCCIEGPVFKSQEVIW
jgi:dihydroorotate dehydrogenase electron transfer subunit